MAKGKTGLWLIGAHGGVATTATVGLLGLKKNLLPTTGLVSELPQFDQLDLVPWNKFAIGGHEIRHTAWVEEAESLQEQRVIDDSLLSKCKGELKKLDHNIKPGTVWNAGSVIEDLADRSWLVDDATPAETVSRLQADMCDFVDRQKLERLVVVNVSSTEPSVDAERFPVKWSALEKTLQQPRKCKLPASSLYAIAALDAGFSYLNFTPSLGSSLPAIMELAELRETCHMGQDGKTGETLMKSVLAPMFAARNLDVMSWVGHNIFGNMDGKVLDDPQNKQTKVVSKDRLLSQILGYAPQTLVSIEYIQSLGDWKTAWDHIHFQGFLGTPMVLQFTWQGCDSILAAPLVLDLARFTERAARRGEHGLLTYLSSFFKSPLGTSENGFVPQFQALQQWVTETA